ncbi:hypothetical protein ACVW00_000042 [Marmoricola sp. URHA0025 HA25]
MLRRADGQQRERVRFRLILSAYAPMLLMFAVRLVGDHPRLALLLAAIALGSVVSLFAMVRARNALSADPFVLSSVKDESSQVPAFLLSYLLPFVTADVNKPSDLVVVGIFLALIVTLALGTDLVLVNPFLLLLGLHLYDVETSGGTRTLLLSHVEPRTGDTIQALPFAASGLKLTALERRPRG